MTKLPAPRENLFRGQFDHGVDLRDADTDSTSTDATTMVGYLAVFDVWCEIHSWFEGDFIERVASGAFKRTFNDPADRARLRCTFDHGYDQQLGDKPLGPIDDLREDDQGAWYEVPLLDTDYNRDFLLPTLQGRLLNGEQRGSDGLLGASFRFRVTDEQWVMEPKQSAHNPNKLPERTIIGVRLMEFGPVVYPAYVEASAGVRSLTDHYLELDLKRSGRLDRLRSNIGAAPPFFAEHDESVASAGQSTDTPSGRSVANARLRNERCRSTILKGNQS